MCRSDKAAQSASARATSEEDREDREAYEMIRAAEALTMKAKAASNKASLVLTRSNLNH